MALALALVMAMSMQAGAAETAPETPALAFHVATNGSDDWSGKLPEPNVAMTDGPFATIARGRDAIRAARKNAPDRFGHGNEPTIFVRSGVYRLSETLTFGPQDAHLRVAAYRDEKPVISGGRAIAGFRQTPDGLWSAEIADVKSGKWDFNELFVNGQRRTRARHPNAGYLRVEKPGPDNRTSFTFNAADLNRPAAMPDAEVVFLHDWSISRVRIAEIDEATRTVKLADPIGAKMDFMRIAGFEPHPRYFVENAREFLDAPGEWFLDRQGGVLLYKPMPGETMESADVVAPVLERLVQIGGEKELAEDIQLVGLTLSHCALPRPAHGYAGVQACFHENRGPDGKGTGNARMPAAIDIQRSSCSRIERCRIEHVGGTGISVSDHSDSSRVVNCDIVDAGGNGVMIGDTGGATSKDICRDNSVTNSRVRQCGQAFFGAVGVWVGITERTIVSNCEISDLPYSGVSVGWSWNTSPTPCRDNRIENNHIHHVMQVLSDGGGIYTLGRQPGTILRGNQIHDVPANAGNAESNGMFIDEGSSQLVIEGNTIWNVARSPIRFHKATANTIRNNVLVCPKAVLGVPPFRFNACNEKDMTYQSNQTPAPAGWSPPTWPATAPDEQGSPG